MSQYLLQLNFSGQDIFRMIENRQDGEPFNLDALKALNPDASMKKGGILKTAGPKVCK